MKQLFPFVVNSPLVTTVKTVTKMTKYGYDDNGSDILDLSLGSCGSFPLGFNRTDIIDYVNKEMHSVPFCPGDFATTNKFVNNLSEKIYDISNGFYSIYSLSGSDSIEGAAKLVHMYHHKNKDKNKIIGFNNAYHGSTYMSTSISGFKSMTNYFGKHHECISIGYDEIEEHIDDQTKAVFIETISWGNNLYPLTKEYYQKLRELCDKHDALLVVDDIAFCGGKTGELLGYTKLDIKPDIFCLGKGISGGYYQLAVVSCNEKVASIVKPQLLLHGYTYSFPMPGILSTLKYWDILESENILSQHETTKQMGIDVMERLKNKSLIAGYDNFGTCFSIRPVNKIKDPNERDRVFYQSGLHLGVWNNDSEHVLIMGTILPDLEYFESLEYKLTQALSQ